MMIKILGALLLSVSLSAQAQNFVLDRQDTGRTLDEISSEVEELKKKLLGDSSHRKRVLAAIYQIRNRLKKLSSERREVTDEILALKANVKNLAVVVQHLSEDNEVKKERVRKRMLALYKFGGHGFMRLLFGSESTIDLNRNLRLIDLVLENDKKLLSTFRQNIEMMEEKKRDIDTRLAELSQSQEELKKKETQLEKQVTLKQRIVNKIKKKRKKTIAKLDKARATIEKLPLEPWERDLVSSILNNPIENEKGRLNWPVENGQVTDEFGLMSLPGNKVFVRHKGIFIRVAEQSDVNSVFEGRILFAGAKRGHGHMVVVDHGSNYYTVYAHLQDLMVRVGDWVKEQTLLGTSGINHLKDEPGLYFEVRYFSEPLNPLHWLKSKKMNISSIEHQGHE